MGGGRVGRGSGWEAGGRLNSPLGLFEVYVAESEEVPAIDPNMLRWCKRRFPITGMNFRPMPSMKCVP